MRLSFYLVIVLLLLSPSAQTAPISYKANVIGVSDDDTITVLDANKEQHKVRLQGIDAPEKSQAFGKVSHHHLSQLVFSKTVIIEFEKIDRYQRQVGKVLVNGIDAISSRSLMGWPGTTRSVNVSSPLRTETSIQLPSRKLGQWGEGFGSRTALFHPGSSEKQSENHPNTGVIRPREMLQVLALIESFN